MQRGHIYGGRSESLGVVLLRCPVCQRTPRLSGMAVSHWPLVVLCSAAPLYCRAVLQVADFGLSKSLVPVDKHGQLTMDINATYKLTGETGSYRYGGGRGDGRVAGYVSWGRWAWGGSVSCGWVQAARCGGKT